MASSTGGLLMLCGSALFFVGAGIAVPRVSSEPDREEKARMLAEHVAWWRPGKPF